MKKNLIFILIILIAVVALFQLIFLPKESFSEKEVHFSVKEGEGSKNIAYNLKNEGLIWWSPIFRLYVLVSGVAGKLQAGEYLLSPAMNILEITEKLVKGDVITIKITIPEGFTVKQIEERLNLELPGENLEGFLFPDTYQFAINISSEEVIAKMRENFDKQLTSDLREEIEKQGKTIFEIITMASLIEKEVRTLEDKKLVSGILWKRLGVGMPLQVDATITYITGKKTVRIPLEDLQIDSPYNTYKYLGLPLSPICNPGINSIIAAIYPQESDYWYYLSTPEGKIIFSKTLEEHNYGKAEYLQ